MRENVTIIIPTCGTNILQALLPCLQTLFIHTDGLRTGHAHRRVVVVANGMKEENKKIFDAFMQKHEEEKNVAVYWYEKPLGYVGAINAGLEKVMAEGDTDYVVFLNDDTQILADNWIDMLLAPFRKDEKMGLVGAKSIPCPVTDIMFPLGWCVMVKKEVLDKVGVLGNEWGLGYGDDIDLAIRAMQAGYKTYSYVQYDKGYFPMRHEAENTMHSGELFSFEDWNKHTAKNRELLAKKYWQTVHVVVPVYRRYRKLEKTLESLYAQYYTKLKIHVVADGHDAKIEEIIAAKKTLFAAKGMEIEYTYVPHEGLFGSRPRMSVLEALSGAEDEWVVFVDSDNTVREDYVLKLWQATFKAKLGGKDIGGAWCKISHIEADHEVPRPGFRTVPVWHEIDSLNYMIRTDIAKKNLSKWVHRAGEKVIHDFAFADACFKDKPWVFVDGEALACHGQPTSVLVLAVCYNEEKLIPFFLRHYENIADRIIVVDGGSTDCSLDLLRASDKVDIVSAPSAEMHNRDLMKIRNEAWKEYRDDYDWVIVCDMDEFLYHPQLSQRLDEYRIKLSVTVPKIIGYQMFAEKFPQDDGHSQIYDLVRNGFADPEHLNKSMIFYAKDVDINYDMGCHSAKPAGRVIYSQEPFYLLHYKYVGYDEFLERNRALAARVSEDDKANHWAYHYEEHAKMSREYFDLVGAKATDVFSAISGTGKKVEWENLKKQDKFTFWEIVERNQYKVYPSFFTNKNVLDVGANIGVFSLLARECGAKQILSVEPNPEALKMLVPNVEGRNIEVLEKAVAAKDGEHMKVVQKAGFVPHDGKTFTLPAEEGVETISLHTLLSHITDPNPIILKIDTEGAEYDFLYGTAPEDFNRIEHILIEMHQDGGSQVGKKNLINPLREYICSLGYQEMGMEIGVPDHAMIFRYDKMHPVVPPYHRPEVTVDICTKNRYYSTLPLTLMSVAMQSYPIRKIILVDDSDTEKDGKMKDLRNDPMYQYFFRLLQLKNIEWEVVFGPKKGQHHNHQIVMDKAKTELIWRIDDDESPEANALEELVKHMQPGVGCVGGLVLDPSNAKPSPTMYENRNKMAEIFSRENTQWVIQPPGQVFEVEHLYSSFLYRKVSDIGYDLSLSPVAHREETIFSHEYFRKGWKVLVTTDAKTWHFRNPQGGIRSTPNPELWEHDEKIFQRKLQSWAIKPEGKIFDIDAGIGDTICFKTILPDLLKKHKQLTIGTYYPTLFKDYPQIKILHPWAVKDILGHKVAELQNVYRHLWRESDRGRKLTLIEAYRELFIDEK